MCPSSGEGGATTSGVRLDWDVAVLAEGVSAHVQPPISWPELGSKRSSQVRVLRSTVSPFYEDDVLCLAFPCLSFLICDMGVDGTFFMGLF